MTVTLTARTVTGSTVTVQAADHDAALDHAATHGLRVLQITQDDTPPDPPKRSRKRTTDDDA